MKISIADDPLRRGIHLRALIYGSVVGAAGFACVSNALKLVPSDIAGTSAVVVALLVGLAIGVWAGESAEDLEGKPSPRWVGTAAVLAVAGTFGSLLDLYGRFLPGRGWLFIGLTVGLAFPAYALGMILPELLDWARVVADDDPDLEFDPSIAAVEGVVVGAALGALCVALLLVASVSAGTILIGCAVVLLLPLALRNPSTTRSRVSVLFDAVTPFGHLLVTQVEFPGERQPERRLYLNGEEESGQLVRSGAPTLPYIAAAESWLSAKTPPASSYLFLGGGAYTLPRRIAERDPRARIVVVELDPEMTRVAQRFFGLSANLPIQTVTGDARAYLERENAAAKFDRIYLDVYAGGETLPFSLVTTEAAERLRERLTAHGVLGVNLIARSVGEEQKALWSIVRTFDRVFPRLAVYVHLGRDYPERQNLLLLGETDGAGEFARSMGGFELWPRNEWPAGEGSVVFQDLSAGQPPVQDGVAPSQPAVQRQRLG